MNNTQKPLLRLKLEQVRVIMVTSKIEQQFGNRKVRKRYADGGRENNPIYCPQTARDGQQETALRFAVCRTSHKMILAGRLLTGLFFLHFLD